MSAMARLEVGEVYPPLLVSIDVAAIMLSIGRTTVYRLIAQGELQVVHIGARSLVKVSSVARFVRELEAAGDAAL